MSHFTVMVIGDNPEEQLAKFDENIVFDKYIEYTKEQAIEKSKKDIEDYKNGLYAEYLKDPVAYKASTTNENHLRYISEEFPQRLEWTDEQHYKEIADWYEPDMIDEEGNLYTTYNSDAKWDWYVLGGRWSGSVIKLKDGGHGIVGQAGVFDNETGVDQTIKGDIANIDTIVTFAVVKNGEWFESASMGWWGMTSDEKDEDEWKNTIQELLADVPDDTLISIYDCHI